MCMIMAWFFSALLDNMSHSAIGTLPCKHAFLHLSAFDLTLTL